MEVEGSLGYGFLGPETEAVSEIISGRLYFVTYKSKQFHRAERECHYFNTDQTLVYSNFFSDFGPLNISQLYRFWLILREKLGSSSLENKKIIYWTTLDFKKRANAAYLIGCFAIVHLDMTPHQVHRLLLSGKHPYVPFQDASQGISKYRIRLAECFGALSWALRHGFLRFHDFDLLHYEHYNKAENGDMTWLVPDKLLALSSPYCGVSPTVGSGWTLAPELYLAYFNTFRIQDVVRLNAPVYPDSRFTGSKIRVHDLLFSDGSVPSKAIVYKFLALAESVPGPVAVHCKAGLGRTGCLVGAYLMKHYEMPALETIAWMRMCRPGCVIGHQQAWLQRMQRYLHRSGQLHRLRMHGDMDKVAFHDRGVYSLARTKRLCNPTVTVKAPVAAHTENKKNKTNIIQATVKLGDRRKKKKTVRFDGSDLRSGDKAPVDRSETVRRDTPALANHTNAPPLFMQKQKPPAAPQLAPSVKVKKSHV